MLRNPLASTDDTYIECIRKQNRFLIDAEDERRELVPEHYPECNNPVPAPTSPVSKAEVTPLDPKAAKEISKLKGHQGSVAFSPDGQTLGTSGDDETIRLWNTKGQLLKIFKSQGNQTTIGSIDFSPDRQKLVSGDAGGKIHLWDLQGNLLTEFVASQKLLRSVKFNPKNEQQLASTGDDGIIYLWNLQGRSLAQWPADPEQVWDLEFSPDGQQIASAEAGGIVRLWNLQGKPLHQFNEHAPHSVLSVAFSPDSKQLVSSCSTGMFRSWSLQDYKEKNKFDDVAYGLGGKLIVGGNNKGYIRLWKVNNHLPSPFWTSPDQNSNIRKVAFSPDGKMFATAADNGIVKLWQLE
jgi:WD40 repeat protein